MKSGKGNVERFSVSKHLPHQYKYWNEGLEGSRTLRRGFHGCL